LVCLTLTRRFIYLKVSSGDRDRLEIPPDIEQGGVEFDLAREQANLDPG